MLHGSTAGVADIDGAAMEGRRHKRPHLEAERKCQVSPGTTCWVHRSTTATSNFSQTQLGALADTSLGQFD